MAKIKTKRERVKFASDNVAGACPEVLDAVLKANDGDSTPYLVSLQGLSDNGSTAFIRVAIASNANLKPEESDNMNFGAIWTPNEQTSLTLDYWAIDYKDVITIENAQGKLNADPNGPDIFRSAGTLVGVTTSYNVAVVFVQIWTRIYDHTTVQFRRVFAVAFDS